MSVRVRPKYPEARAKAAQYSELDNTLSNLRSQIASEVSTARSIGTTTEDALLMGDYYNRYVIKKNDWIALHSQIISSFDTFLVQLDSCIASASSQAAMWRARIGEMEEY